MKSFTIFTSSAMVDHIIFYYFPQKRFGKWLGMKSELQLRYCSCKKMFLGTVANFKNFWRPNKEIKYFSRKLTEFKDFERQLLKFETFSRLYEPWMDVAKSRNDRLFLLNPIQV